MPSIDNTEETAWTREMHPDVALIAASPFFDEDWYAATFRDVTISGCDPAAHYLWLGADLGRDPGPNFSTRGYLAVHLDVMQAGVNPLLHYERWGRAEKRRLGRVMPPSLSLGNALAASKRVQRDWAMSEDEARAILAELLEARRSSSSPMRVLSGFDAHAARRYVAAAEVLYDEACQSLKATVIIPTYNRAGPVVEAVRSVLSQSHTNLELLVVDDGSTDNTAEELTKLKKDLRLRVFLNDHQGVSSARNTGLEHATGDYVFYLDSDNTWTSDHLMLALVGLQGSGAECAYAASCLVTSDGEVVGYRGEPFDWNACLDANYVDMNVFAHTLHLCRERGGFDTDLRRVVDWDLILRYTKGQEVAFFPYIGCRYLEHAGDQGRISVSQPWLYRKVVAEKNRQGLASGAETLDTLSLRFGIKIAAPRDEKMEWGDYHFAESLAVALRRLGHSVRIDFAGEWHTAKAPNDDVALLLRGLGGYQPRPGQLTLMWNISHPDQVSYAEYEACHAVMVASRSYAALLSMILERPIYPMLQCTDIDRFHLGWDKDGGERAELPGIFVGNSRNEYRQMVRWSVGNDVAVDVFGTRWEQYISQDRIKGFNIPNTRLSRKYREAGFVLNDHWQSMKDFGLVSNRIFDVVASGGRLISDHVPTIKTIFGDIVDCVENEAEFLEAVLAAPAVSAEHRREAARYVEAQHSFDARAETICTIVRNTLVATAEEVPEVNNFTKTPTRRRVGLLMQRGRAWWTSSAFIRLIGPLTTEHAHALAGLDLIALEGVDDPRLATCDVCIVQRVAVAEQEQAKWLVDMLTSRDIPLYVDTDDAFFLHPGYRDADGALRILMKSAEEVWFSTSALAELYADIVPKDGMRVRSNALDPRFWQNYRAAPCLEGFGDPLRIVYMGTATHSDDLAVVMPAFERLAEGYPGRFHLTLIGVTDTRYDVPWLSAYLPERKKRSYPEFVRHLMRETTFDVGIAPLADTPFNAAKSDVKFLDYSAMGLLSVLSAGRAYHDVINAGLALGVEQGADAWYNTISAILERPDDFAEMRKRANAYLWEERNVLTDPVPLANLVN